eukprot:Lithocolla_globosa_v1_NODE_6141_length_1131_cov_2.368959.p1 type:complete len:249 gc:universal NODE_6141_length_1131_cov_2.368959:844-98(-)
MPFPLSQNLVVLYQIYSSKMKNFLIPNPSLTTNFVKMIPSELKNENLSNLLLLLVQSTPELDDEATKEALLASFAEFSSGSHVEIVFSFDTTGSMSSCLHQVRQNVENTVRKLMKDIGDIRIGVITHGDYCDGPKAINILDLNSDVEKLCSFINTAPSTGGGDAPENYEYVLQVANGLSWNPAAAKALVVIGDEAPHPPSYTDQAINWWDELDNLVDKVKSRSLSISSLYLSISLSLPLSLYHLSISP